MVFILTTNCGNFEVRRQKLQVLSAVYKRNLNSDCLFSPYIPIKCPLHSHSQDILSNLSSPLSRQTEKAVK
jgi:hypothetical protein